MGIRNVKGYTDSLDELIVALCRDYPRRSDGSSVRRVEMEYRYINTRMLEAVTAVAGDHYAREMIREIGEHIGHAHSHLDYVSETSYKRMKSEAKLAIARKLYLFE